MFKEKSDCDIIFDDAENMFNDLGNCFDTAFDKRKSKMNVVGSIFNLGKSLTKLTVNAGVYTIKNAPKAIVSVAAVKREVVTAITEEIHEHKKQVKIDTLNEKIKQLGLKT